MNDMEELDSESQELPHYRRPWILLIPLGFAAFLFFLLTLLFLFGPVDKKHKEDDSAMLLLVGGIMAFFFAVSFFVCVRLYRGPRPGTTSALPLWFIRGFGLFMALGAVGTYLLNKTSLQNSIKSFVLFLGIAITGDVVQMIQDTSNEDKEKEEPSTNSDPQKDDKSK
ncbi:hypothetical protein KIH39_18295 [Telmatocola sphagniphila]|uniref:Transmembrane protein n=1 Tax=Telmatocola sphagniphila TaxID=1123043 RepID=A0A8E6B3T1_9BACT|nr:hypothetical protein [Telmatocola sphagniphila]QVL30789.1 hypothetical protein KIH39_18295 [Telmatocola sphagniphila]